MKLLHTLAKYPNPRDAIVIINGYSYKYVLNYNGGYKYLDNRKLSSTDWLVKFKPTTKGFVWIDSMY
ncbi:hypothetical protein HYP07_gp002 [Vibrio phage JSF3]|uniref:hypothetical protein n=1 Tax=Vibrio phage JSF3 TaxID=1916111 RepID=UPI000B5FF71D|nr:hypothetical protein HYP07_gp002 [Vibrio phage JSF3]APD18014.1 hypothetical protein [Vibrio phage JSF3]